MTHATAQASIADVTPATGRVDNRRRIALALMVASGFAGLGYQIVWTE